MRDTCAAPASYAIPLHRLALEDSDVDALVAALKDGVFGFFGRHAA